MAEKRSIEEITASIYDHLAEAERLEALYQQQLAEFRSMVEDFGQFLDSLKEEAKEEDAKEEEADGNWQEGWYAFGWSDGPTAHASNAFWYETAQDFDADYHSLEVDETPTHLLFADYFGCGDRPCVVNSALSALDQLRMAAKAV